MVLILAKGDGTFYKGRSPLCFPYKFCQLSSKCPHFPTLIFQSNEKISLPNFQRIFLWVSQDDFLYQGWPFPPSLQSGTINVLQVWTLRMGGCWNTSKIMLEGWNLEHKSRITHDDEPWRQGWLHPPSLQSGTFRILQVWLRGWGGSWGTSKHARELKFGRQVKNHKICRSMKSRMTPSSKSPVRNLQRPPSMTWGTEGFLRHFC